MKIYIYVNCTLRISEGDQKNISTSRWQHELEMNKNGTLLSSDDTKTKISSLHSSSYKVGCYQMTLRHKLSFLTLS